jgi:hypothetical protein
VLLQAATDEQLETATRMVEKILKGEEELEYKKSAENQIAIITSMVS